MVDYACPRTYPEVGKLRLHLLPRLISYQYNSPPHSRTLYTLDIHTYIHTYLFFFLKQDTCWNHTQPKATRKTPRLGTGKWEREKAEEKKNRLKVKLESTTKWKSASATFMFKEKLLPITTLVEATKWVSSLSKWILLSLVVWIVATIYIQEEGGHEYTWFLVEPNQAGDTLTGQTSPATPHYPTPRKPPRSCCTSFPHHLCLNPQHTCLDATPSPTSYTPS